MDNHTGHRRHLYLTNILISLGYASAGCVFSWTSPTLPRLMEKDSWLPITEEQGSWIGSFISFGGIVGPLTSGTLLDKLGRKWTIVLGSFFLLMSWVVLGLATCLEMVFLGRFIAGFAAGTLFMVLIIYIAETSDDTSRGMLSSTTELSLGLGFNLEYFAGPYLSYQHLIMVSSILPVSFILMFIWLPETPYYLVSKGKTESAIKSLRWYRGNISLECAEKEIVIIESTMYEMMQKKETFWDLMKVEGNRRALYITCFLMAAQQFSGINVLQLYSELIFMYSGTTMKPAYCAMTVGTFQLIGSMFAAPITKRFGYKKPLLITCIFISIVHFFLGLFFYFSKTGRDISSVDCMPVVCLVLYIVTYSATLGPLPWGVVGEIFPTNMKATASSFVTAVNFLTTFFVTKFFTNVSNCFGLYTSFWIFTASMIVSFFFILLVQPETKGMSLQDIQNKLNDRQTSSGSTT